PLMMLRRDGAKCPFDFFIVLPMSFGNFLISGIISGRLSFCDYASNGHKMPDQEQHEFQCRCTGFLRHER
ncbi:MAG: hypothetical protein WA707_24275, partial [Pseudolabrys sp.]